jgi:hydroxymethylbilane synthase
MARPDAAATMRIGSRGSELAVWQAMAVVRGLTVHEPGIAIEHIVVQTTGDRVSGTPLATIGVKGLFTKELEEALLEGRIDIAVHSLKDMPTACPAGLAVGVALPREDPRDVLVASPGTTLDSLPPGSRVGTSSLRRRAQLLARRPDLTIVDIRGNVATRLEKLDRGECDALVLARAGLIRLGLSHRVAQVVEVDVITPAVGQGALAVESRVADLRANRLLHALDHRPTRLATLAERAFLSKLDAGCQLPVGALGTWQDGTLTLAGIVADVQGRGSVRGTEVASVESESDAAGAGTRLADRLLTDGARRFLDQARPAPGPAGADVP